MPTPLPVIRGASTALYPFTQTFICLTGVSDAEAGNTSRCVSGFPLVRFEFPYDLLLRADKDMLKSAFTSAKGQFDGTLTATTDTTYDYLSFDEDVFSGLEQVSTQYGVKWAVTQTLPQNLSPGASGSDYPTLANGAISQLPYTQRKRFKTIVSKLKSGPKYTYAEYGGGLTNFPTDGLMAWEFNEQRLTDAEANTKIAHFLANWGDAFPFHFTDEDTVRYAKVYYGSPQLTITRLAINQNSIKTLLVQTN